jgi:Tol biopolymer transport system component
MIAYGPAWSPDGETILFTGRDRGRETLFTVSPGGGRMHRVTDSSRRLRFPAWSPDGRRIVCESYDNHGDSELVVMRADGTRIKQITRGVSRAYHHTSATYPDWSPDGRWIVYSAPLGDDFNGPRYLFVIHPDGSGRRQLTVGPEAYDTKPRWSPDGRLILFWRSWEEWKLMVLDAGAAISVDGEVTATGRAGLVAEGIAPTGEHWDSETDGADIGPANRP